MMDVLKRVEMIYSCSLFIESKLNKGNLTYYRIQTFHKKTDACHVALVLNTQGLDGVYPGGYQCPGRIVETPQGLNSFPTIFSYPGV